MRWRSFCPATISAARAGRGDKVGISVSGQSGLARFFKPPPVEQKKIPDIVMYEARQQIPFSLDEVIWDYQQMPGASEEDGIALDMEIGLFAMKRDQVFKSIRPFEDHDVELDMVQLSPLCLYNCASHDLLEALPDDEEYDSEDPPESIALLSLGTDASDLVVTNGYRVWQRSIPLGGSHFTRQLTKELKLTFAKAEHLKRNARQAEDPRKIFQAMRPVFNDLVTEVQRSLNYFQSIDRNAKIGKVYLLGNATKLPGLSQYLGTNIGYEVVKIDKFSKLTGKGVVGAPSFSENVLAFPVCYGLCLQGLGKGNLLTSLLPQEILTDRLIKSKKPWAVAIAGTLLLGLCLNYTLHANAWRSAHDDNFKDAVSAVSGVKSQSQQFKTRDQQLLAQAQQLMEVGDQVIGGAERRLLWLELFRAINDAMPRDEELANPSMICCLSLGFIRPWMRPTRNSASWRLSSSAVVSAASASS